MRILVVEDEQKIANSIKKGLEQESYAVDVVYDGREGYDYASVEEYDVVILDLLLPGLDGISICRKLRAENNQTPILILTAKSQLTDKVTGLNCGADDYLTKPFAFAELLARIRALTRRPRNSLSNTLTYADLQLDTINYLCYRNGKKIYLTKKEFALLEYLLRHANRLLTKQTLIQHVWEYDADVLPNTVEAYIKRLRQKIETPFPEKPRLIHTLRGFGYKLMLLP